MQKGGVLAFLLNLLGKELVTIHVRGTKQTPRFIVTGDLNIADVEWSTQYVVSNAYNYLFKVRNANETFRDMNEAVMREVIGDRTINEVLTSGRSEIQQEVKDKLQSLGQSVRIGNQTRRSNIARC